MKTCTTHHHACDCREQQLLDLVLFMIGEIKCNSANTFRAMQSINIVNSEWKKLYGVTPDKDTRFQ